MRCGRVGAEGGEGRGEERGRSEGVREWGVNEGG